MKKDACGLLDGTCAAASIYVDGRWLGSMFLEKELSQIQDPKELLAQWDLPEEHMQKIREKGAMIRVEYWKRQICYEVQ